MLGQLAVSGSIFNRRARTASCAAAESQDAGTFRQQRSEKNFALPGTKFFDYQSKSAEDKEMTEHQFWT